jgi:hypothetical protein
MGATAGVSLAEEVLLMSKSVEVLGDTFDCFAWGFVGAGAALSSAILGNKLLAADAFTAFAATLLLPGMPDALSGFGSIVDHWDPNKRPRAPPIKTKRGSTMVIFFWGSYQLFTIYNTYY